MKSNLYSYIPQLKLQAKRGTPSARKRAVDLLNYFDVVTLGKLGKKASIMTVKELEQIPFDMSQKDPEHKKFWGKPSASNYSTSYQQQAHFFKKIGKALSKAAKGVGKAVSKVTSGIKKAANNAIKGVGNAIKSVSKVVSKVGTLPILPFKGAMKKALDKKGVKYGNNIEDIAKKFVTNVVKKSNFEGYEQYYEASAHVEPLTIAAIVSAIVGFFKKLKAQQGKGDLPPEEQAIVDEVEAIEKMQQQNPQQYEEFLAREIEKENISNNQGGSSNTTQMIMIIVGLLLAAKVMKII